MATAASPGNLTCGGCAYSATPSARSSIAPGNAEEPAPRVWWIRRRMHRNAPKNFIRESSPTFFSSRKKNVRRSSKDDERLETTNARAPRERCTKVVK
jgi:hypothetical protein